MVKVMAFGTFDIIHPGHEFFLREANKLGQHLTIVIARDETVQQLKGQFPRVGEAIRLKNLQKLRLANKVILGSLGDKFNAIKTEKPDVIALGHDQKFFVKALRRFKGRKFTIQRLSAYHPELYKTSKIAPRQPKQLIVVLGVIVKNRRLLLLKRVDPRTAFNGMWELPGGGVEYGESIDKALRREVFEETGFKIQIKDQLNGITTIVRTKEQFQIFFIAFIVKPTSGKLKMSKTEASAARWCTLAESLKIRQFALNKKMLRKNLKLLKKYVD